MCVVGSTLRNWIATKGRVQLFLKTRGRELVTKSSHKFDKLPWLLSSLEGEHLAPKQ